MSGEAGSGQPAVGSVPRTSFLDDDLSKLSVEDLRRVRMWVEDRFTNAITPLNIRLQREPRVHFECDGTLVEARNTVNHVMEHVREIRDLETRKRSAVSSQRSAEI